MEIGQKKIETFWIEILPCDCGLITNICWKYAYFLLSVIRSPCSLSPAVSSRSRKHNNLWVWCQIEHYAPSARFKGYFKKDNYAEQISMHSDAVDFLYLVLKWDSELTCTFSILERACIWLIWKPVYADTCKTINNGKVKYVICFGSVFNIWTNDDDLL